MKYYKHEPELDDNINEGIRHKSMAGAALITWGLRNVTYGLLEIAEAIREHTTRSQTR